MRVGVPLRGTTNISKLRVTARVREGRRKHTRVLPRATLGTNHADAISIKTGISSMHESNKEKLLGVIFDNKFTFEEHISCVGRLAVKYMHFLALVIYQIKANY